MRIVAALILIPLLVVVLFLGRKAYWDYRVTEMCERDGGMIVFEPMVISQSEFVAWGGQIGVRGIPIPHEFDKRLDVPVFRRTSEMLINDGNPVVRRDVTEFIRRTDAKVLGRYTYYSRVGGDLPSWAHHSSFGCLQPDLVSERVVVIAATAPSGSEMLPNILLQGTLRNKPAQRP